MMQRSIQYISLSLLCAVVSLADAVGIFYILSPPFHAPKRDHIRIYVSLFSFYIPTIVYEPQTRRRDFPVPFVCFISSRYSLLFVFFSFFLVLLLLLHTHTEQHIQLYTSYCMIDTTAPILHIISLFLTVQLSLFRTSFIHYSI